ncbi:MAG: GxxExxY protein [Candidatus Binatia bacterium]
MTDNELSTEIIGAALEVHRALGPGLLEGISEECLAIELDCRGVPFERQQRVSLEYTGQRVAADLRLDMIIDGRIIVEPKAVETLLPVHGAQLLSYRRRTGKSLGLLINCNVPLLRDGITRIVDNCSDRRASAPLR